MTIQLTNAIRESATITGADLMDICDRIRALSASFDNYNTRREADALNNYQRGRPAYWSMARYTDAAAGYLCDLAHHDGLEAALDRIVDDKWPAGLKTRARLLSTLIPLNRAAEIEKGRAVSNSVQEAVA